VAVAAPFLTGFLVGASLLVIASVSAWDLTVLVSLAIDSVRRRRGQRPIRVGIDYGAGEDTWFETAAGPEPYRSCGERRLLARGDPMAAARQVGSVLATRLGVGTALVAVVASAVPVRPGCIRYTRGAARTACNTIRQATMQWRAVNPLGRCPTVEDLKADRDLDTGFALRDPWGGRYEIRCGDDEIICSSPGPDRQRGTEDDIVIPLSEVDGSVPGSPSVR
jgi:hypothetical protein